LAVAVTSPYAQDGYRVRFDWGPPGADAVGPGASVVAVVDVLSFTTTLSVAVEQGIAVLPYRWRDDSAAEVARAHDATLAAGRSRAGPDGISLSPDSIRRAGTGVRRLVLPSPNGSTVAARLAETGARVIGVSLRNVTAAAAWVRGRPGPIAVVAAGERWYDGPLRPAVEDLWGAGAFIAALGTDDLSPEAGAARAAYREIAVGLPGALAACASGRELIGNGYPGDVVLAAEIDAASVVPVLIDGWFTGEPVVAESI
jgi:2-phosphosulfolactate phosphatase